MFYTYDETAERLIVHDWEKLLIADGFDSELFNKKHQDCPICGVVKGFRAGYIGVESKKWRWVCKGCTSSKYESAYEFMMQHYGFSSAQQLFKHIYQQTLSNEAGLKKALVAPRRVEENSAEKIEKSLRATEFLWGKSRQVQTNDPVWKYLNRRVPGLTEIPEDIHYTKAQYWETDESNRPQHLADYDAMVLRGYTPQDQLVQMHTTYLTADGQKAPVENVKKTRPGCGFNSYAFRIGVPRDGVLGLSEGVETALSASVLYGMTVWPCHSSSVLQNFEVPESMRTQIRQIIIFADNDRSKIRDGVRNTGLLAAKALAKRLRSQGYRVRIMMTARVGDFNNHLNQVASSQV